MYDGAVADHSNTDVVMHVAWPAAVACRLCVRRPLRTVHVITGCRTLWKKALHNILEARKGWVGVGVSRVGVGVGVGVSRVGVGVSRVGVGVSRVGVGVGVSRVGVGVGVSRVGVGVGVSRVGVGVGVSRVGRMGIFLEV